MTYSQNSRGLSLILFHAHLTIHTHDSTHQRVGMDLDTIQDLLGGSNLPPPPSVEDLLGDVMPIPASPSPPPDQEPSLCLYSEHSYSKV